MTFCYGLFWFSQVFRADSSFHRRCQNTTSSGKPAHPRTMLQRMRGMHAHPCTRSLPRPSPSKNGSYQIPPPHHELKKSQPRSSQSKPTFMISSWQAETRKKRKQCQNPFTKSQIQRNHQRTMLQRGCTHCSLQNKQRVSGNEQAPLPCLRKFKQTPLQKRVWCKDEMSEKGRACAVRFHWQPFALCKKQTGAKLSVSETCDAQ